jgi:hypothetical protein
MLQRVTSAVFCIHTYRQDGNFRQVESVDIDSGLPTRKIQALQEQYLVPSPVGLSWSDW